MILKKSYSKKSRAGTLDFSGLLENIIAFLITSNVTKVLDTIVSRCQYLVLDTNSENENSENS